MKTGSEQARPEGRPVAQAQVRLKRVCGPYERRKEARGLKPWRRARCLSQRAAGPNASAMNWALNGSRRMDRGSHSGGR